MNQIILDFLQHCHLLQDLDEPELQAVAQFLRQETYTAGQVIYKQGTRSDGLYFIFQGDVQLQSTDENGEIKPTLTLHRGDFFGELEVCDPQPRLTSVEAQAKTIVLRWERKSLEIFLETHPRLLARLCYTSRSRKRALAQSFAWLHENETIYILERRHPALLAQALILPVLMILGGLPTFIWAILSAQSTWLLVGILLFIAGALLTIWRVIDWRNDFYLLTNHRAIWLEKVVGMYENRQETPLHWVLSVGVSSHFIGRMLNFGDILIRTYTGSMTFENVGETQFFLSILEEHWQRLQQQRIETDRETMIEALSARLQSPDSIPLENQESGNMEPGLMIDDAFRQAGLDHWSLRLRFEEEGIITYRKHWAVLAKQLLLPSVTLLLTLAVIGTRLVGSFLMIPRASYLLYAGIAAILALLWWLYRFIDWANEIYQITPTHIVAVNKTPFARETRKVAPLENILGTEVEQKGLLGLLLNYGNVIANVGTFQFVFAGILKPGAVQQDIARAQDAFLQRKQESEHIQRRAEVVEWISTYHEEIITDKAPTIQEFEEDDDGYIENHNHS